MSTRTSPIADQVAALRAEAAEFDRKADEFGRQHGPNLTGEFAAQYEEFRRQARLKGKQAMDVQNAPAPRVGPPSDFVATVIAETQLASGTTFLTDAEAAGRAIELLCEMADLQLPSDVLHGIATTAVAQVVRRQADAVQLDADMCDARNDRPRLVARANELYTFARRLYEKAQTYLQAELAA